MVRMIKSALAAFVALFCLMYAMQNIVNLDEAYGFVAAVLTMSDQTLYPSHFGPAITSPALIWAALIVIITLEVIAGALAGKGALDLWMARKGDAATFNRAKTFAIAGCGVAVLIWFGLFSAFGGAYFQMWQTQLGGVSLAGAFQYSVLNGLVLLIIQSPDE